jgi:hypothetical protein
MAPLQVASWIPALLPIANIGTLLLNLEYFIGDTSSAKDFDKSDKGTTNSEEGASKDYNGESQGDIY